MKQIFRIDNNGFLLFGKEKLIETNEIPDGYIDVPLPTDKEGNQFPFYKPKWNGESWEEGLTQAEIDAIKNIPVAPTDIDLLKNSDTFLLMELMNTQVQLQQEQKNNADLMFTLVDKGVI